MADIFPRQDPSTITNAWERRVVQALHTQLKKPITLYPNFFTVGRRSNMRHLGAEHLLVSETDLVLVAPHHGVLLIEVKGPSLEMQDDGNWAYVNGNHRTPAKHPVQQAVEHLGVLKECLQKVLPGGRIPFPYGFALVFPGHEFQLNRQPAWYDPAYIFTASDMLTLGNKVLRCLREWNQFQRPKEMESDTWSTLQNLMADCRQNVSSLEQPEVQTALKTFFQPPGGGLYPARMTDVRGTALRMEQLTKDQGEVLEAVAAIPRLGVRGMAGSGKTVIAVDHAIRLADQGKKVLLLCYNEALGKKLARQVKKHPLVHAFSFYSFVNSTLKLADRDPLTEKLPDYWEDLPANRLSDALDALEKNGTPLEYDALVVDEAQDFRTLWWLPLEAMIRPTDHHGHPTRPVVLFYDPLQNIFGRMLRDDGELQLPDQALQNLEKVQLKHNCRNTRKIAQYIAEFTKTPFPCHPDAVEGEKPLFLDMRHDWQASLPLLKTKVHEWLNQGYEMKDIAILQYHAIDKAPNLGNIPLTDKIETWSKGEAILHTTVWRFKGLEAEAVVMYDIPKPGELPSYGVSDHYVAVSRAKQALSLFVRTTFQKPQPGQNTDLEPMQA